LRGDGFHIDFPQALIERGSDAVVVANNNLNEYCAFSIVNPSAR